jgi:hypothetical protein
MNDCDDWIRVLYMATRSPVERKPKGSRRTGLQIVWILLITGFGSGDDWCEKCALSANGLLTTVAWSVNFVGLLICWTSKRAEIN